MSETTTTTQELRHPRSFTKKALRITLTVAKGGLGQDSTLDTVTLEGYRCQVEVTMAGLAAGRTCNARIYGLPLPLMNRLSLLAYPIDPKSVDSIRTTSNTIMVEAGDDQRGFSTVYYGMVTEAFADFQSAPEPAFQVYSGSVQGPNVDVVPARMYPKGTPIAEIVSSIAIQAGYSFSNYGLNARLPTDKYLYGTLFQQINQLQKAYKFIYDFRNGVPRFNVQPLLPRFEVTIWSRSIAENRANIIPSVNAKTGLIGYPSYSASGIAFTSLFDQRLEFMTPLRLESNFLPAAWVNNQSGQVAPMPVNGGWITTLVTHELDSEIPNGRWFTHIEARRADAYGKIRGPIE